MERLVQVSAQYNDGLLSAREYLGIVIDCVGREWQSMPDQGTTEFADALAKAIAEAK